MPVDINIRPITENDASAIAALSEQLGYGLSVKETSENISKVLSDKTHTAFAAYVNEMLVGWIHLFITIRIESNPFVEIGGLVVDKNHRKQGVGKLLVEKAREWAKEKHIDKLRVRCNRKRAEAHQFYAALGFSELKEQKVFETIL